MHADEFKTSIQELVDMIEKAQQTQPDNYLNIYFTVVDKEGKFQNTRDLHEMCEYNLAMSHWCSRLTDQTTLVT